MRLFPRRFDACLGKSNKKPKKWKSHNPTAPGFGPHRWRPCLLPPPRELDLEEPPLPVGVTLVPPSPKTCARAPSTTNGTGSGQRRREVPHIWLEKDPPPPRGHEAALSPHRASPTARALCGRALPHLELVRSCRHRRAALARDSPSTWWEGAGAPTWRGSRGWCWCGWGRRREEGQSGVVG